MKISEQCKTQVTTQYISNPDSLNREGKGIRGWRNDAIQKAVRSNPTDPCLKQILTQALNDTEEYWQSRSGGGDNPNLQYIKAAREKNKITPEPSTESPSASPQASPEAQNGLSETQNSPAEAEKISSSSGQPVPANSVGDNNVVSKDSKPSPYGAPFTEAECRQQCESDSNKDLDRVLEVAFKTSAFDCKPTEDQRYCPTCLLNQLPNIHVPIAKAAQHLGYIDAPVRLSIDQANEVPQTDEARRAKKNLKEKKVLFEKARGQEARAKVALENHYAQITNLQALLKPINRTLAQLRQQNPDPSTFLQMAKAAGMPDAKAKQTWGLLTSTSGSTEQRLKLELEKTKTNLSEAHAAFNAAEEEAKANTAPDRIANLNAREQQLAKNPMFSDSGQTLLTSKCNRDYFGKEGIDTQETLVRTYYAYWNYLRQKELAVLGTIHTLMNFESQEWAKKFAGPDGECQTRGVTQGPAKSQKFRSSSLSSYCSTLDSTRGRTAGLTKESFVKQLLRNAQVNYLRERPPVESVSQDTDAAKEFDQTREEMKKKENKLESWARGAADAFERSRALSDERYVASSGFVDKAGEEVIDLFQALPPDGRAKSMSLLPNFELTNPIFRAWSTDKNKRLGNGNNNEAVKALKNSNLKPMIELLQQELGKIRSQSFQLDTNQCQALPTEFRKLLEGKNGFDVAASLPGQNSERNFSTLNIACMSRKRCKKK